MIIVKNREMLIPDDERNIGTTYDTESEFRSFRVPRFSQSGVDLSNHTFRLDLKYANDAYDTVVLTKDVSDNQIVLTWEITSSQLQVPGTLYIAIRAVDNEATVKWSTYTATMFVERHLNTPGNYTGDLTEIEQMEQDHQYMKGVVDELKGHLDYRSDAEAWAVGQRSGEDVESTDPTYHNNSKYYKEQTEAMNHVSEAYAKGTVEGVAVESGDTGYHDNALYYSQQAAATVADTNTRFDNALRAVSTDTELIDIRVKADGTTASSAGNAIREQVTDLKAAITPVNALSILDFGQNWVGTNNGATISKNRNTVTLTGTHTGEHRFVSLLSDAFYISDNNSVTNVPADAYTLGNNLISGRKYKLTVKTLSNNVGGSGYNYLGLRAYVSDNEVNALYLFDNPSPSKNAIQTCTFVYAGERLAITMQINSAGALSGITLGFMLEDVTDIQNDIAALSITDFGNDWALSSYDAKLNKTGNVYTIKGTRSSTYRYYSVIGSSCVVSSSTTLDSLPSTAFNWLYGKLFPNVPYRLCLKVLEVPEATTAPIIYYFGVKAYDEGGNISSVGPQKTVTLDEPKLITTDFMLSEGQKPAVAFQLRAGTFTGTRFVLWIENRSMNAMEGFSGFYKNIAPYMKRWKKGYFYTDGSIKAPTSTLEKYTSQYIPLVRNGLKKSNYLLIQTWIKTETIGSQYMMVAFYDDSAFLSRAAGDAVTLATVGDYTVSTYAVSIPANAARARVACRFWGDDTAKAAVYLADESSMNVRPYIFEENVEDYANWLAETTIGTAQLNIIKPHIGVRSINHRGWHQCPENTLVAYKQSKVHGFEAGECDVRFTSDNVPVLLHDATINRTARNADGTEIATDISIGSITYEQALEYDFGIRSGSEYAGTKIPTLAEYLKVCRNIGLSPYIEIESGFSAAQHKIIADTVIASGVVDEVTFISSDSDALKNMQTHIPYARYGIIPWTYSDSYVTIAQSLFNNKSEVFIDMSKSQITSAVVATCAAANVPIEAWTTAAADILAANPYVSGFTSNDAVASDVLYNSEIS